MEVDQVLADPAWRWIEFDLPQDWQDGYLVSARGRLRFVHGTPYPRRFLLQPPPWDPVQYRERQQRPRRFVLLGLLSLGVAALTVGSGEGQRTWLWIGLALVSFFQAWALSARRPLTLRFVAWHIAPAAAFGLFGVSACLGVILSVRYGRNAWAVVSSLVLLGCLAFVFLGLRIAIQEWPKRRDAMRDAQ